MKGWKDVKLQDGKAIIPGVMIPRSNLAASGIWSRPDRCNMRAPSAEQVIAVRCRLGTFAGRVQVDTRCVDEAFGVGRRLRDSRLEEQWWNE